MKSVYVPLQVQVRKFGFEMYKLIAAFTVH